MVGDRITCALSVTRRFACRTNAYVSYTAVEAARALGVEHFGQTGTIADLYRRFRIDANAIVAAAQSIAPGKPIRYLRALS